LIAVAASPVAVRLNVPSFAVSTPTTAASAPAAGAATVPVFSTGLALAAAFSAAIAVIPTRTMPATNKRIRPAFMPATPCYF